MPLAKRYRLGYANLEATTRLRQRQRAGIAAGTETATQRKEKGKNSAVDKGRKRRHPL